MSPKGYEKNNLGFCGHGQWSEDYEQEKSYINIQRFGHGI
jgi:hypothetical protein